MFCEKKVCFFDISNKSTYKIECLPRLGSEAKCELNISMLAVPGETRLFMVR